MNTVNSNVINYVQSIGCGVFGQDLFFGRVPSAIKTPTSLWWIVPISASSTQHNVSGEDTIRYQYELHYRCQSVEELSNKLFKASQEIVGTHCYDLENYQTIDVKYITTNQDTMLDSENRVHGWIVFTVTVYNILETK